MKVVQVGILVALVAVGALLYKIYEGQQTGETAADPAVVSEVPSEPVPAPESTPVATAPNRTEPARAPQAPRRPSPASKPSVPAPVAETRQPEPMPEPPAAQPTPSPLNPPRGTRTAPPAPTAARTPQRVTVPAGTLLSVRLGETVTSEKNKAGDTFTATLDQPLVVQGLVLAERGARVQGRVLESVESGRVKGVAALSIHLVRLRTADGQEVGIQTDPFVKQAESSKASDAKKVGVGAAIGAAIGAIAGGGKGAAIGAGVGGAAGTGTVLATRGNPAELPVETRLTFRLTEPVTLTEKLN